MDDFDKREWIAIEFDGDPVPWSAPVRGKWGGSLPNKRLVAWQARVREEAVKAFGPYQPWTGPLSLQVLFKVSRNRPKGTEEESWAFPEVYWDEVQSMYRMRGKQADLTNLIKAVEDGLESIVYVNDAQIVSHHACGSFWSKLPGVKIVVTRKQPWTANEKSA
jgi:Holliday junction resolvase RusA-like endonuclease